MSFVFLGLAFLMLVAATAFVVHPSRTGKPLLASPAALLVLFVPLSAIALYALLGSPDAMTAESKQPTARAHKSATSDSAQTRRSYGSVASLVDGLRDKLEAQPDDAGGWILLAKSYQHLGRDAEAAKAYAHARALGKTDLAFEATLLGPSLASQPNVVDTGPVLRGRVSLAPEAAARVQPNDTVFIFAKESPEHRMPVVALRKRVSDLPLEFALTNKEMMVPDSSLDDYPVLVVTAKISRSGNASDSGQGLEAWSGPVSPEDEGTIELVITRQTTGRNNNNE